MGRSASSAQISRYARTPLAREWHCCNQVQEAVVFADDIRCIEAWSVLPQIDKRIAMKWLVPGHEASVLRSYELVQEAVWRRPENVTNVVVSKAAHLVSLI
jgi:hypothetical protein